MPNVVNRMMVRELSDSMKDAEGMLFVSFGGLSVKEDDALRTELGEQGVRLRMIRNKLARIVLKEAGYELPKGVLEGNVALTVGTPEETVHAAKVLTKPEVKKAGKVSLKAGVLDGRVLSENDVAALADVPDKDTLRAQLLGVLSAPARTLVSLINAPGSSLARVIQAHVDAAGAEAAPE
jgi:large subunit ribosomal protein L10